jgi:hypothetical protein
MTNGGGANLRRSKSRWYWSRCGTFGSNAINLVAGDQTVKTAPDFNVRSLSVPTWANATIEEKLEIVRQDMNKAYEILNRLIDSATNASERLDEINRKMTAVLTDIRNIQRRLGEIEPASSS